MNIQAKSDQKLVFAIQPNSGSLHRTNLDHDDSYKAQDGKKTYFEYYRNQPLPVFEEEVRQLSVSDDCEPFDISPDSKFSFTDEPQFDLEMKDALKSTESKNLLSIKTGSNPSSYESSNFSFFGSPLLQ